MQTGITSRTLRPAEAARYTGMSLSWLAQARARGDGPPYLKVGARILYLIEEVDTWLEARHAHRGVHRVEGSR